MIDLMAGTSQESHTERGGGEPQDRTTCPGCGMVGVIRRHGKAFCSEHCLHSYEREHGLVASGNGKSAMCHSCAAPPAPWYKERLFLVSLLTLVFLAISYLYDPLKPWFDAFVEYLSIVWWAILLGLLLGGLIDRFVPREYVSKHLSGSGWRTILKAVALGFFMSACSHGILALSVQLHKKGASVPAVIAFLLASPWANLPVTVLLFGFFGYKALYLVVSAIAIAISTGLVFQLLDRAGLVERNRNVVRVSSRFSIVDDLRNRWRAYRQDPEPIGETIRGVASGSWALSKMVLWWLIVGMIVAATAGAFVPEHYFMMFLGANILGLLVTLALATVIEVCSEGSAPMAFEIFRQTGAFGNGFTFLMAGVATDYTEIGIIWSNVGRRAALWLPLVTVPQILVLGYLFNLLL